MIENALAKEQLEKILNAISEGLDEVDVEEDEWYSEIIWQDFDEPENDPVFDNSICIEDYFAMQAVKHPELLPLVREIVNKFVALTNDNYSECFIVDGEWNAGMHFAKHLALANADDTKLFSRYFLNSDPDHVEDGCEPILTLAAHHGWQKNTVSLMVAPFMVKSQHASEMFTIEMCKEATAFLQDDANAEAFFSQLAEWNYIWKATSLPDLFEVLLDELLGVSENTDTGKLAEEYVKLVRERKVPGKAELIALVAQYTD